MKLKKKEIRLGKYTTYIWSLITVILSVVIIFVSSLLPGSLLNLSYSDQQDESLNLDMPQKLITTTLDSLKTPVYFPDNGSSSANNPELYSLKKTNSSEMPSLEAQNAFCRLAQNTIYTLFDIEVQLKNLQSKCYKWDVYLKSNNQLIDTMFQININLFDSNSGYYWIITTHGKKDAITHISRTLMEHPSYPPLEDTQIHEEDIKAGIWQEALETESQKRLSRFWKSQAFFGLREDVGGSLDKIPSPPFLPFLEKPYFDSDNLSYTITFALEDSKLYFEQIVTLQPAYYVYDITINRIQ